MISVSLCLWVCLLLSVYLSLSVLCVSCVLQVDMSSTRKFEGTGLGLAIVVGRLLQPKPEPEPPETRTDSSLNQPKQLLQPLVGSAIACFSRWMVQASVGSGVGWFRRWSVEVSIGP